MSNVARSYRETLRYIATFLETLKKPLMTVVLKNWLEKPGNQAENPRYILL